MLKEKGANTYNKSDNNYRIEPSKFNLFLFMIASSMLFAGLISAYIVHMPDSVQKDAWTKFELPNAFIFSTITIFLSSVTIFFAWLNAKNDEIAKNRFFLFATLALALGFCGFQILGWKQLINMGLTFVPTKSNDISASYVWVFTSVHILHILGGLVLIGLSILRSMQFRVHKKSMKIMNLAHTYWHFLGIVWIYLFLFIYFAD